MIKLATWNINSVRLRINLIKDLIDQQDPDIICLQETKVMNELFPEKELRSFGYDYIAFNGQKSYNGVAILSKIPFDKVEVVKIANSDEARHISVLLPCGTELHNFYVPAGGDEPDIEINPKYKFKLEFVDAMLEWFEANRSPSDKIVLVGDLNIAPLEHDVWSHKQLRNVVSHTEPEIVRLNKLRSSFNWVDVGRHFVDDSQKLYSWWSYRNKDWRKSNRGRRLDHIWVTPCHKENLTSFEVLENCRDWTRPSDHVPVIAGLKAGR